VNEPQPEPPNLDASTVRHFGEEWTTFAQDRGWGDGTALERTFAAYFAPLPPDVLNSKAVVGDFGAGSGRWARIVAPKVARLYLVEPSDAAMRIARTNLGEASNVTFIQEPIGGPSMIGMQLDLAYSLGVIHHIPNAEQAVSHIKRTLKPGGYFLCYLYYSLENRPFWYRALWRASDFARSRISRLGKWPKLCITGLIAALVYWPFARVSKLIAKTGRRVGTIPLSQYADKSLYIMWNDSLDRFGTPLERRFSKREIEGLVDAAGFDPSTLVISRTEPFWCFAVRAYS
jgi:SAM-dependent methyltransferase